MKPWCEGKEIVVIERGEREFLIDTEGRRYIDGVSSLWCNVHGHCVPELDEAVRTQLSQIAHSTLLGLANVPSVLLGKRLVELARRCGLGLDRVFYSDNGSTAVEVACKMAYQYWQNKGSPRPKFLTLNDAYHGDTLGAVSVGGIPLFHQTFRGMTFPVDYLSAPPHTADQATLQAHIDTLDHRLKMMKDIYAAIIIEPLIQGAGGMRMHAPGFLREVRRLSEKHDILLIADEVMTGFGRTGKMFACEHELVTPDLMCLSKGLTAGYMPLGVTLTTKKVFDAFYADPREGKTFFHGHTFTGHPLACTVALASLDLFKRNDLLAHVAALGPILDVALEKSRQVPGVSDARQIGLIGAIDVCDPKTQQAFPPHWRVGGELCTRMRALGLMMRPLADTLVIMPPLAISVESMRLLCDGVLRSLEWIPEIVAARQGAL